MTERVTPDGEVVDDSRTPLQIARSELAAFKFATLETVRADPRLSTAPCLAVISVYLGFVTVEERTLKPTTAFASTVTLMARASIRSKTTARAARKLLVEHCYLVRDGETKDGCEKYRVENPHFDRVQMHVHEAEERLKQIEADRREEERRKKKLRQPDRGSDIDPTQDGRGVNNWPDRGSDIDPNYHRGNLGESGSEEEGRPIKVCTTPLSYGEREDDPHQPLPVPTSEDEAIAMLDDLRRGANLSAGVLAFFRKKLWAGELTPHMIEEQRRLAAA